ncbi:MAG: LysM peptidoglycan-binding domain-containing protein [Hyphomicrobiaceae bacterium]|nr:LysM peptidoglycan-binding domain-containing protein [Hyphomicrobiaceae bacterium]
MLFRPHSLIAAIVAVAVSACSTQVIRDDGPGWSLADRPAPPSVSPSQRSTVGAAIRDPSPPPKPATADAVYKGGRDPVTGKAVSEGAVSPEPKLAVRKVKATTEPSRTAALTPGSAATSADAATAATATVAKGDTLHGLSLKHKVSVKALMTANNLTTNKIFPGQKLVIPAAPQ